jgi:hypothetical protein
MTVIPLLAGFLSSEIGEDETGPAAFWDAA